MDFIQQVGTRYVEGKAYAAPQQLENFAKKQFRGGGDRSRRKGSERANVTYSADEDEEVDEEEEDERSTRLSARPSPKGTRRRGKSWGGGRDERDLEIARLRGELEESRRGSGAGARREAVSASWKEERGARNESVGRVRKEERGARNESVGRARKEERADQRGYGADSRYSSADLYGNGVKAAGGAFVADAASRSHRERRPEYGAVRGLGRTVDGKGVGVSGGAFVAEKAEKSRGKSRSRWEPEIVEAGPRRSRRSYDGESLGVSGGAFVAEKTERSRGKSRSGRDPEIVEAGPRRSRRSYDGESERERAVESTKDRRKSYAEESEYASVASSRAPTRRRSLGEQSVIGSTATPPARRKSIMASRGRRPSPDSDVRSVIAPRAQVEAIRRRQRSRGRGIEDAVIDTPAPETPSLRALSRRRRSMDLRHGRRYGSGGDDDDDGGVGDQSVHLPERRKSVIHERLGEGSVIDVLEVNSVPFRPHRENGGGYKEKEERRERSKPRKMGIVEVVEDRGGFPVARQLETGGRDGRRGKGVVEVAKGGGRTVYRVR